MRWAWLQESDNTRAWSAFQINIPQSRDSPFRDIYIIFCCCCDIYMVTNIGDGQSTLFWTDRWIYRKYIGELTLALMPFVKKRGWRNLTVREACIKTNGPSAFWEVYQWWHTGSISSLLSRSRPMSVTNIFGRRACQDASPPNQRMNACGRRPLPLSRTVDYGSPLGTAESDLTSLNQCWTTDRLARRGMDRPEKCVLCEQHEDIQHIMTTCVFSTKVWFTCLTKADLQAIANPG